MSFGKDTPPDVNAMQAQENARVSNISANIIGTNIKTAQKDLLYSLQQYDEYAGNVQGSTALMLARSGALTSRSRSSMYNRDELGMTQGPASATAGIDERTSELATELAQYETSLGGIQSELSDVNSQISAIESAIRQYEENSPDSNTYTSEDVNRQGYTEAWADYREERDAYNSLDKEEKKEVAWADRPRPPSRDEFTTTTVDESGLERARQEYEQSTGGRPDTGNISALQNRAAELRSQETQIRESMSRTQDVYNFMNELNTRVKAVSDEIEKEAGSGVADLQQLTYMAGSTLSATSRALVSLKDQRDIVFNNGLGAIVNMTQSQISAERNMELSEEQAVVYQEQADIEKFNMGMQTLFTAIGMTAGIALGGGPAGASLGASAGSVLGNVFSRR